MNKFDGKKIAILGSGVEGRATAEWLGQMGLAFEVLDESKDPDAFKKMSDYDIVFRSPGIPFSRPEIQDALKNGSEITSVTKEFFRLCPAPIIGITGSNGKTTTSALIMNVLKKTGKKIWRAGNDGEILLKNLLRDEMWVAQCSTPTEDTISPDDLIVMELSSFQLWDLDHSPHVAVFTNFSPNHLDVHVDLDEYFEAKTNIVQFQLAGDFAILDSSNSRIRDLPTNAKKIFFGESKFDVSKYPAKTHPNNFEVAKIVGQIFNISDEMIDEVFCEFRGVSGRLELVRELDGTKFWNDTSCTTPESAMVAIDAFEPDKLILLLGGKDKGMDFTVLGEKIVDRNVRVVLYGTSAKKIGDSISDKKLIREAGSDFDEVLLIAREWATSGDSIVLSPACASFDMFANAKERGRTFTEKIELIQGCKNDF